MKEQVLLTLVGTWWGYRMTEPEVILAIVGVLATTVGFLGWIIREQFKQNNTTLKEHKNIIESLTEILEKVHKSFDDDRECRQEENKQKQEFQDKVCKTLDKISTTQDVIMNRQLEYGEDIVCTKEIVVTTIGGKIKRSKK